MSHEKNIRPSWDDYFMSIVKIIATRGTCDRLYAGAVLVKDKRIISTGYNGAPPGLEHCDEVGHLLEEGHCVRTVHAEHNALLQAAIQGGVSTPGSTLYTKYSPCIHCAKYIVACKVKRVVMSKVYRNSLAVEYLKQAGLEVEVYQENAEWNKRLVDTFNQDVPEVKNEGEINFDIKK